MPIYEYKCDSCATKFEKLLLRADPGVSCPTCGDRHLTREYSTFSARAASPGSPVSYRGSAGEGPAPQCGSGMCRTPGMCGMN